jgi:chloramphenicol-sensitive protein RarD
MRIIWSVPVLVIAAVLLRRSDRLWMVLRSPRLIGLMTVTGLLVGANWFIFIVAVTSGRTLDASLGYYLNPMVSVALGVIVLRERLTARQWTAVALAMLSVVWLLLRAGEFPWIALSLAFSFGAYGLMRKRIEVDPISGLLVEVMVLLPAAALLVAVRGDWSFDADLAKLSLSGLVTVVPLLLFVISARRLRLSTVGMLQYIAPTGQFLCALLLFSEVLTAERLIAFIVVWIAVALFVADGIQRGWSDRPRSSVPVAAR